MRADAGPVVRKRKPAPGAAYYVSLGKSVEKEAKQQTRQRQAQATAVRKRAKRVQVSATRKQTGGAAPIIVRRRQAKAKQTAPADYYASLGRAVEHAATQQRRGEAVAPAEDHDGPTVAGAILGAAHVGRVVSRALGEGITAAGKVAGEAVSGDYLGAISPKLKAPKGGAGGYAHDVAKNISADAAELAVTTPSSLAKLGVTAATEPEKLPGLIAQPYKELAKDPVGFIREHPVSAALMLTGPARGLDRAAGRVARLAGKQTLEREPATLPGTPLREARTGPRGLVAGAVSARRERGRSAPEMTRDQVEARVDDFYAREQQHMQAARSAAARQSRERGHDREQAQLHMSGTVKRAQRQLADRWTQEFGEDAPLYARQRLRHHRRVGREGAVPARVLRTSRRALTKTVLPLSVKRLTGDVSEAGLRSLLYGAGPVSYVRARRLVSELERQQPGAGKALLEHAAPGGLIGRTAAKEMTTKTLADEFAGAGAKVERVAQTATKAGALPVVREVRGAYNRMTKFMFDQVSGKVLEGIPQTAMLGAALKRSPLMERRVIGLSDKAIREAAEGLKNTEAQVALAREVRRAYGKYNAFSPGTRSLILHWSPFLAWSRNTVEFLTSVLPKDHPLAAALAADVSAATEEWRKQQRLSRRADHVPSYLLGGYPAGGGIVPVGRYLPAAPGGNIPEELTALLLPQFSDAYQAAQGRDWRGEPLHGTYGPKATGKEETAATVAALAEAMIPGVAIAKRAATKGPQSLVNPFMPAGKDTAGTVKRKGLTLKGPAPLAQQRGGQLVLR